MAQAAAGVRVVGVGALVDERGERDLASGQRWCSAACRIRRRWGRARGRLAWFRCATARCCSTWLVASPPCVWLAGALRRRRGGGDRAPQRKGGAAGAGGARAARRL